MYYRLGLVSTPRIADVLVGGPFCSGASFSAGWYELRRNAIAAPQT